MKAIQVKFLPATNFKDARMKAWTDCGNSVTVPFKYELSSDEIREFAVAEELIFRMKWKVFISGTGTLPKGNFVFTLK